MKQLLPHNMMPGAQIPTGHAHRSASPEPTEIEMRIVHAKLKFKTPLNIMLNHPAKRQVLMAAARRHMKRMEKASQHDIKKIQAGDTN